MWGVAGGDDEIFVLVFAAAQFLNESGYVLRFVSSSFNGLESLYFIDPQWLSQTLAKFIGVDVSRWALNFRSEVLKTFVIPGIHLQSI